MRDDVPDRESGRPLADRLFGWGRRGDKSETGATEVQGVRPGHGDKTLSTKAFGKFLGALSHAEAPVLLDLGPIVGTNVNFLGERLGCKIFVEDVYANLEAQLRGGGDAGELSEYFKTRFPQPDESFDGILCWDVLDYLDKASAQVVAGQMTRLLKPGGALLAFFATVPTTSAEYTRYLVVDDTTLNHRAYPATRGRQQVFVNRDINRMFEGLTVSESFLLLTKMREMVFRKPERKPRATS
jgi:SAM-dependent methyltransferase